MELVEHYTATRDQELIEQLRERQAELASLRVRQRITLAIRMRLELQQEYAGTWHQALALQARPSNAARAIRQRAALVDELWHAAGDTSTDTSWYTKRGLLAAVYASTELFSLSDTSPGFEDTWAFLDRRIDDVMSAGKRAGELTKARIFIFYLHSMESTHADNRQSPACYQASQGAAVEAPRDKGRERSDAADI